MSEEVGRWRHALRRFSMNTILEDLKTRLEAGRMPIGARGVAMERVEVTAAQTTDILAARHGDGNAEEEYFQRNDDASQWRWRAPDYYEIV
ncbi:hypothetical protein A4G86_25415 [Burkholderia pseudomallei]|uniref:hypothetical protein n=1 Tax=Burkholderia pseudomallei TaxID=28450 RepID=UPI000DC5C93B|nr:hypothetical protein [Burkholderia pseudomallei]RAQ91258.1 hypothetical protein A4G86_25415 [Burkholderia pseudomallei]